MHALAETSKTPLRGVGDRRSHHRTSAWPRAPPAASPTRRPPAKDWILSKKGYNTIAYQGHTQRIFCTSKSLSGVALVAEEKDARSAQSETKQQDKKKVKL